MPMVCSEVMITLVICAGSPLSVPAIILGPLDPLLMNPCRRLNRSFDIFNFHFGTVEIFFILRNPFLLAIVHSLCQF